MKKVTLILTAFFLLAALKGYAQQIDKFAKKGQWEVGGAVGFTSMSLVDDGRTQKPSTNIYFMPSASYFVADGFELGAIIEVTSIDVQQSDATTDYTLYFVPAYNFNTKSMFYPYIQEQIGYGVTTSGDFTSRGLSWAFEGGVKANVVPHVNVKLGINYSLITRNQSSDKYRKGWNSINAIVGFGVFF